MKETKAKAECDDEPRKMTLLRRFDIPIEHLDFRYVESCSSVKELEKILKVLRSGEEGFFPDLIKFTEDRLRTLDPENCCLRVELPVLKSKYLEKGQQDELLQDLSNWIENIKEDPSGSGDFCQDSHELFSSADLEESEHVAPIRGTKVVNKADDFVKQPNPSRIKSWEYDKWDKFDADAELTKMEVTDMQIDEWERLQKPKIKEEQKTVEGLMKGNEAKASTSRSQQQQPPSTIKNHKTSSNQKPLNPKSPDMIAKDKREIISVDKPSFIEEVVEPILPKVEQKAEVKKPRRRIKVLIEDVNAGGF